MDVKVCLVFSFERESPKAKNMKIVPMLCVVFISM